jgi:Family of unknown function (DUF6869)
MTGASSRDGPSGNERLIDSWIRFYQDAMSRGGDLKENDENYWASKILDNLIRIDPESGWEIIEQIVAKTQDHAVLACIGSGPLENLLAKHGRDFVDRVVQKIREDARFAEVAASVWQNVISDDVWLRLQEALGQRPANAGF